MRITFLVDNLPHPTLPLLTEHGLSLYIETNDFISGTSTSSVTEIGRRILCDMGASGAYIKNAKALGIDLDTCHWAFLSHGHADHTGGLGKWIAQYGHIPVYASHHLPTLQCYSSRPKKVASHKSKVASQCKVSAEASLLDYAEPQPDFMSEANKVESRKSQVASQCKVSAETLNRRIVESLNRLNDSTTKQLNNSTTPNSSLLTPNSPRYIGPDLNLFHGHTPWFKPIEQNTWLTPHIALVFPTCSNYPTPLGNKYLYTDESTNRRIGDVLTTERNNRLTPNSSLLTPNFLSSGTVRKTSTGNGPSTSSGTVRDDFSHEIALCFVTPKGLVIVSSCSHHGALNTIQSCMEFTGCNTLHAYIGGLHFVDSPEVEAETTSFINDWLTLYPNAHLYTGHCTCPRAATMLKAHIPHCHTFYTGNVVEI